MRKTLDWEPYYAIARRDLPFREKLAAYAAVAHERLETDRFAEFCATHLGHLDDVARDFFGTDRAKDAVRQKVAALYPPREVEEFTEMFWNRIQAWRREPPEAPVESTRAARPPQDGRTAKLAKPAKAPKAAAGKPAPVKPAKAPR